MHTYSDIKVFVVFFPPGRPCLSDVMHFILSSGQSRLKLKHTRLHNDLYLEKSHTLTAKRDMLQFFSPRCKRKTKKEQFLKQNIALRPGSRAEGCFLRCCRSFFFSVCVLALKALNNTQVCHYRQREPVQNSSNQGHGC